MSRIAHLVAATLRSLIALACAAVLVAGVPLVMWSAVGRPLPDGLPPLAALPDHLQRGSLRAPLVALLAVLVWVCWLRVAVAMVVQLAWRVRGMRAPRVALLGSSQRLAATLLAGIVTIASVPPRAPAVATATGVVHAPRVVASAAPRRVDVHPWHAVIRRTDLGLAVPLSVATSQEDDPPVGAASVVVRPGDTLSGLARTHLGSAARWPEIWEANRGRTFGHRVFTDPDLIFPGWDLLLPEHAAGHRSGGATAGEHLPVDAGPWSSTTPPGHDGAPLAPDVVISLPAATVMPAPDPGSDDSRPLIVPDVPFFGEVVLPSPATEEGDEPTAAGSSLPPLSAAPSASATPDEVTPASATPGGARPPVSAPSAPSTAVPDGDAPDAGGAGNGAALPTALAATSLVVGGIVLRRRRRRGSELGAARSAGRQPRAVAAVMRLAPGVATLPDEARLERLGRAWRAVGGHLADPVAWPAVWVVGDDGTITARFPDAAVGRPTMSARARDDHDTPQVMPPGWHCPSADAWVLPAALATREIEAPIRALAFGVPSLLHVGRGDDGDVYLDVQRSGGLALVVDAEAARRIAHALAQALVASPFAEETELVVVTDAARTARWHGLGFRPWVASEAGSSAVGAALVGAAVMDVVMDVDVDVDVDADVDVEVEVAVLRRAPVSETPWGATIVFVDSAAPHLPALARRLRTAGAAVVAVHGGTDMEATTVLRRVPSGWLLEPCAVPLLPLGLEHEDVTAVHALLEAIGPNPAHDASAVPRDAAHDNGAVPSAGAATRESTRDAGAWGDHRVPGGDGCVHVRVLGPVCVEDAAGRPVAFERAKSQELLCWLVLHRDAATRSAARTALWDTAVRDSTFANVLSDVRRSLSAAQPEAPGDWLRRVPPDGLRLHDLVVADAETLDAALTAHAADAPDALELLQDALALVRGAPFAGGWFSWADAEGITTRLTMAVVDAAVALADRFLAQGRPEGVFPATAVGLSVLPGCDALVALRLRAHAATGDLAGLRAEWDAYERHLEADPWVLGPSPDLVQLRNDLTAPAVAAHA